MHVSTHHATPGATGSQDIAWRTFFRTALRVLAVGLLASGVVSWIAANWDGLGKFERIAGVQGLLAVTVGIALVLAWRTRRRPALAVGVAGVPAFAGALFLASVVTGGLLALLGQTYQTGADPWTLFAWWAVLMLPWLWAARSWFVIVLWLVVLNTAIVLLLGERSLVRVPDGHSLASDAWTLVAVNAVLLALAECLRAHFNDPYRVVPRLLILATLVALFGTLAAYIEYIMRESLTLDMLLHAFFVAAIVAAGFHVYRKLRPDAFILSQLAVFTVLYAGSFVLLASWLLAESIELSVALAFIVGLVGLLGCVSWLRQIHRSQPGAGDTETMPVSDTAAPVGVSGSADARVNNRTEPARHWPLLFLFSFGFLFLLGVALILLLDIEPAVAGAFCVVVGLLVYFVLGERRRVVGATLVLAGALLLAFELSEHAYFGLPFPLPALALAIGFMLLYHVYRAPWYQFLCAIVALLLVADVWLQYSYGLDTLESRFRWYSFLNEPAPVYLALATIILMALPSAWAVRYKTLAWALLCLPLGACLVYMYGPSYGLVQHQAGGQAMLALALEKWRLPARFPLYYLRNMVFALLPVVVAWLSASRRQVPWPDRAVVLLVLLGLGVVWGDLPGVQIGLLLCVLGYELRYRSMLAVGIVSIILFLAQFYYQLSFLLLDKAQFLIGQGLVLLVIALVWHWVGSSSAVKVEDAMADAGTHTSSSTPAFSQLTESVSPNGGGVPGREGNLARRNTPVIAAIVLGLVAVLVLANVDVVRKEAIIRDGTRFVVALHPVDPRSLMQGDYMTLNFVTAGAGQADVFSDYSHHYVELAPDAQGIFHFTRTLPALTAPEQPGNVVVRYRRRIHGGILFVTNAYFFQEGRGEHFARARYGEFRVSRDGTALLVGLLDEQQNRL